jgi:hypothetical protein
VADVHTPKHLIPLRTSVRRKHAGELILLFQAIDQRFDTDYVNVSTPRGRWH